MFDGIMLTKLGFITHMTVMNTVQLTLHTISHHFPAQNFVKISVTFGLHKAIV